jgi:hypothetical protein
MQDMLQKYEKHKNPPDDNTSNINCEIAEPSIWRRSTPTAVPTATTKMTIEFFMPSINFPLVGNGFKLSSARFFTDWI